MTLSSEPFYFTHDIVLGKGIFSTFLLILFEIGAEDFSLCSSTYQDEKNRFRGRMGRGRVIFTAIKKEDLFLYKTLVLTFLYMRLSY